MTPHIIHKSAEQHSVTIDFRAQDAVTLSFDIAEATFDRSNNDLSIVFDNGSQVTLTGFFETHGQSLPNILLADGTKVSGASFLESMNPDMDLTTAAGAVPTNEGNGTNYNDAAGELVGGLERLGSLGNFQWGHNEDTSPRSDFSVFSATGTPADTDTPADDEGTQTIPPIPNYEARAVLYKTDAHSSDVVKFRLLNADGPVNANPSFTITDENGYFILPPTADPNEAGIFLLELSPKGAEALAGAMDENIYEYLTITVDGHEYRMQVVVNQDGQFSSLDEDKLSNNGANVSGYEWHNEEGGTGEGIRVGDTGSNEVWLSDNEDGAAWTGDFSTLAGNDTFHITNSHAQGIGIGGGGSIDTGGGNDSLTITTGLHGMASGAIFNAENIVINAGGDGLHVQDASETNTILNAGTVHIDADREGLHATHGGNTLQASGEVNITSGQDGLYAKDGVNTVKTTGNIVVNAGAHGLSANGSEAVNTIEIAGVTGTVNITGSGTMPVDYAGAPLRGNIAMRAYDGGENIIRGGGGVTLNGEGYGMGSGLRHDGATHEPAPTSSGTNLIENINGNVDIHAGGNNYYAIGMGAGGAYKQGIIPAGDEADKSLFGTNTIKNVDGNVTIGVKTSSATRDFDTGAMQATYGGENLITEVRGNVTLTSDSKGSSIMNTSGGSNIISNVQNDVILEGTGTYTGGMHTNSSTYNTGNTIEGVEGSVVIHTTGVSMQTSTSNDSSNANNIIRDVSQNVTIETTAWGMASYYDNANIIENVGGSVSIKADSTDRTDLSATAYAMQAHGSSGLTAHNDIANVAGSVTLEAKGRGTIAGMTAYNYGKPGVAYNRIENVGDVTITAVETWGQPSGGVIPASTTSGMRTKDGANYITNAESLTINIASEVSESINAGSGKSHTGYGLYASGFDTVYPSGNFIQGVDTVKISINPDNFTSVMGMYASGNAKNVIDNSGYYQDVNGVQHYSDAMNKAITVVISVPKGAYAMYGNGKGNHIIGSKEADLIEITGRIGGQTNIIKTGDGDDTVILHGKVDKLQLEMGEGEHDLLILKADNLSEFNSFYYSWITNSLLKSENHGVNRIEIHVSGNEQIPQWLEKLCLEKGIGFGSFVDSSTEPASFDESSSIAYGVSGMTSILDDEADRKTAGEASIALPHGDPHTQGLQPEFTMRSPYAQAHPEALGDLDGIGNLHEGDFLTLDGLAYINAVSNMTPNLDALSGYVPHAELLDFASGENGGAINLGALSHLHLNKDNSPLFLENGHPDAALLSGDNIMVTRVSADETLPLASETPFATEEVAHAENAPYGAYANDMDEFALIQQVVTITG